MRSEREMLALIIDTAMKDERIRLVIMNGSRANPHAPRDMFQDYDIVYMVTDVEPFINNREWIKRFGDLMIMEMPETMQEPPPGADGGFAYLMQFLDGNRIDLGIYPLSKLNERLGDSLSVLLLDKDGIVKPLPPPSESDYLPRQPNPKSFSDCCTEFWWICTYVAKGLWRDEVVYAHTMLDHFARSQLHRMLAWHIGSKTGFSRNLGKFGKYYRRYLEPEVWNMLERTYADGTCNGLWEALFAMCDLFRVASTSIAQQFGYEYPSSDDQNVTAHLRHVRGLPRQATEMY